MKRREGTRSDEQGRGGANTTGARPGSKGIGKTEKHGGNGKAQKRTKDAKSWKWVVKTQKRNENIQFLEIGGKNAKKRT